MAKKTLLFLVFLFPSCQNSPVPPQNIQGLWEWKEDSCITRDNKRFKESQRGSYQFHIQGNGEVWLYILKTEVSLENGGKAYCDLILKGRYEQESNTIKMNFTSLNPEMHYQVETKGCNQMPVRLAEKDIPKYLLPYFKQKLKLQQPADHKLVFILPGVSSCKDQKMKALFHSFSGQQKTDVSESQKRLASP